LLLLRERLGCQRGLCRIGGYRLLGGLQVVQLLGDFGHAGFEFVDAVVEDWIWPET